MDQDDNGAGPLWNVTLTGRCRLGRTQVTVPLILAGLTAPTRDIALIRSGQHASFILDSHVGMDWTSVSAEPAVPPSREVGSGD